MLVDNRMRMLKISRAVCAALAFVLLMATGLYAAYAILPRANMMDAVAYPAMAEQLLRLNTYLLASDIINAVVLLTSALLFGTIALRKGNPFTPAASNTLLALGILFFVHCVVKYWIASQALALFGFIDSQLHEQLAVEMLDVSAFALAATFVLLSFVFRYARELYLDSSEIL